MGSSRYEAGPLRQGSGVFIPLCGYWPLGAQATRHNVATPINTVTFAIQSSVMEALNDMKTGQTAKGGVSYSTVGCRLNVSPLPNPTAWHLSYGLLLRYSSRSAIFWSLPNHHRRILVPGTTSLGASTKAAIFSGVQTMPEFFISAE